jgi:hypothetical protein
MSIAHRLAGKRTPRTEEPNIRLAEDVCAKGDIDAVAELGELLDAGRKKQRHDALKVLYEIGLRKPELVVPQLENLIDQLDGRDNRILWGTIYALSTIAQLAPKQLMGFLPVILAASDRATVIAKDKAMLILAELCMQEDSHKAVVPKMLNHVAEAAVNQFPTYAERAEPSLRGPERKRLAKIIRARVDVDEYPAKRKRMDKLLLKLEA